MGSSVSGVRVVLLPCIQKEKEQVRKHLLNYLIGSLTVLGGVLITLGINAFLDWTPAWAAIIFVWIVLVPAVYAIGYLIREILDEVR